ncbi:MAG: carboxy terminal-processing peptidase [Proteobacteria bacterium]|uniref:carboxy terminal-processing peptidase n=1 Tax=Rudaea sp. TaxID=2136325 RepID=UPI001E120F5A|nr:carboxy terminal-processing peptidase [Pseudomonadota bacterium]MBS0568282.1 carboxy terminal-processing peptidase [Pseudomonadota bacterium]
MLVRNRKALWFVPTLLAAVLAATLAMAKPAGDAATAIALKPTPDQADAAQMAMKILSHMHYKPEAFDTKMSQQVFDRYLDSLDADRLFFTQADIDRFTPARDKLGEAIRNKDLSVPFAIFNLYVERIGERTAFARAELKKGFDFGKDESYQYQRDKAPWAKTDAEVNDLWRKRVKNDWLRLKLAGKDDAKIRETLDKRYANYLERVRQLTSEDAFSIFANAYAMSIEPHTNYLSPRQAENFEIAMKLSLEGIGAVLQREDDYTAIREVVPGGPAALSGKVKVGDRIVGVGQGEHGPLVDVVGWRLDDVVEKIRGAKDTTVRLEILPADAGPDGKHMTIALVRKKVAVEEQAAKSSVIETKDGDVTHKIGVITLPTFYQDFEAHRRGDANFRSATRDVARLLGELKKQNVEGVLIDLRNNGGGSLDEATTLTGLFIDKGPVVQVRSANGRIDEHEDRNGGMAWNGPLAVLVNRNSASASEIFAAAIQDYGRGLIIGEPTFGKGTVQNLLDLDQMYGNEKPTYGELKMTIQQFFRVNGGSTQLRGVTPDIAFPVTGDFAQNGEQSYDNALPWTSIPAADYRPTGDLKALSPLLAARHDRRAATEKDWIAYQADVADARKLREDKTISLNEAVRRKERDEQEAKRRERHPEQFADAAQSAGKSGGTKTIANAEDRRAADPDAENPAAKAGAANGAKVAKSGDNPNQDDGLQADERSLKSDLAEEKRRKAFKDVVLNEAAHIVADEVDLLRADTKLAAQVLPRGAIVKDAVN